MKRLLAFARSVIPADPAQLLFLGGSILLLIDHELRCYPVAGTSLLDLSYFFGPPPGFRFDNILVWRVVSSAARFPVFLAGAAGLFICFRPGPRPARRILTWVSLPALLGMVALFVCLVQYRVSSDASASVLATKWGIGSAVHQFWTLGPAVRLGFLGIALALVFAQRLARGRSSLPLALRGVRAPQDPAWQRMEIFICAAIAGISVIHIAISFPFAAALFLEKAAKSPFIEISFAAQSVLDGTALALVAAWAAGPQRWKELRQFVRFPAVRFALLGPAIPVAIRAAVNLSYYAWDRILWAAFEFRRFSVPQLRGYFSLPQAISYLVLPAAAAEEIIWRGYLQPRFVRRFGILRGIFLLGLVWGAFHFSFDFSARSTESAVPIHMASRLATCILHSYVLAWLTLRARSIWPAALAHGFYNVWLNAGVDFLPLPVLSWTFWGLAGYLLFRWWPPPPSDPAPVEPIPGMDAEPTAV